MLRTCPMKVDTLNHLRHTDPAMICWICNVKERIKAWLLGLWTDLCKLNVCVLCCSGLNNVVFKNFSVISRVCLVEIGSSMFTFIELWYQDFKSQTLYWEPDNRHQGQKTPGDFCQGEQKTPHLLATLDRRHQTFLPP